MKQMKICLAIIIMIIVVTLFIACNSDKETPISADINKYSNVDNWQTLPESATQPVEVSSIVIDNFTGAQNSYGALVIDPEALPAPGNYQNLNPPYNKRPGWYHNYDYGFFFFNLEQNVINGFCFCKCCIFYSGCNFEGAS